MRFTLYRRCSVMWGRLEGPGLEAGRLYVPWALESRGGDWTGRMIGLGAVVKKKRLHGSMTE